MSSRRAFLQSAATMTVASAVPLSSEVAVAGQRGATLFATTPLAVFDSRYPDARLFGRQAERLGAVPRAIVADITELWRQELRVLWQAGQGSLLGLTEAPALFLLERLGWDHDLRVIFQAEHELATAADGAAHCLLQCADTALPPLLVEAGNGWPAALATALMTEPLPLPRTPLPTAAGMAAQPGENTKKLHSWIIAPRTAVRT